LSYSKNFSTVSLPEFGNNALLTLRILQFFKNKGKSAMAELMAKSKMAIEMRKNNPSVRNHFEFYGLLRKRSFHLSYFC
jgi:hypothetical protein